VGLAQREIEAAGIATVTVSTLPDFTRSVGAPRVAGIRYPMGRPFGAAGDAAGQRAVLVAALRLLETAREPGEIAKLPFAWPEPLERARPRLPEPTPIGQHIRKRPWLYLRFLAGDIPD
jgi:hypothetical protein